MSASASASASTMWCAEVRMGTEFGGHLHRNLYGFVQLSPFVQRCFRAQSKLFSLILGSWLFSLVLGLLISGSRFGGLR